MHLLQLKVIIVGEITNNKTIRIDSYPFNHQQFKELLPKLT